MKAVLSRSTDLTDIEIVDAILRLCGVGYQDGRDQSGRPFWFGSLKSNVNVHWHIFFSPDGTCRLFDLKDEDSASVVGRPCKACTAAWGRLVLA